MRTIAFILILFFSSYPGHAQDRAAWMREARWGVMNHYLADWRARVDKTEMSVETWNQLIDNFDVEGLAEQIKAVGAGYYIITAGQNSGYYLSPNATYDRFVGIQPSKCSRRDLVADLYEALHKRSIKLMVYLPSGAPNGDKIAKEALQWQNGPYPNKEFQIKWEQIIREWSERWGNKVAGWWFDGCYWPNLMYQSCEAPNFESFAAAARAGNPARAVAFNRGVVPRLISITPHEDYTAGEINDMERLEIRRASEGKIDGAQIHVLSFLGERWGMGTPRFTEEQVLKYTRAVANEGGVITWDVPIQANGLIAQPFIEQLAAVGKALNAQTVYLNADGRGDTYELIKSVLSPQGELKDIIDLPDCAHPVPHLREAWDDELLKYVFVFDLHVKEDNDRCKSFDRQRNEIKTYDSSPDNLKGTRGETHIYQWKFKVDRGLQVSHRFTHLFQIKARGGSEDGMPIITLTAARQDKGERFEIRHSDSNTRFSVVTDTSLSLIKGVWLEVHCKATYDDHGKVELVVKKLDGTSLLFYKNDDLDMWRTGADFNYPKWGIYRGLVKDASLRDEQVRFADFSITKCSQ